MVLLEGKKYVEIDKVLQSAQYFSVVNASINDARERKIVTLNIIILSRPVRTVQSFSSVVVEGSNMIF